jgi:hypothetical protein
MSAPRVTPTEAPTAENAFHAPHARLLCDSYRRLTGRDLLPDGDDLARRLFEAPFAVLSHGGGHDPLFTYGNRVALALFELTWAKLLAMPSRLSAEPLEQAERARLLARVAEHGFIDDYAGVRISRTGQRFRIEAATVWTLTDAAGLSRGQAATFNRWSPLF